MRAALCILRAARATRAPRPLLAPLAALPATSVAPTRSFSTSPTLLKKGAKAGGKAAKGDDKKKKGKKEEAVEEEGLSAEEIDDIVNKGAQRMEKSLEWAKTTVFDGVERGRGRVTPAILDNVKVAIPEQGLVPLKSVASITVKGNVLSVDVWDSSVIKHVESSIHKANLPGISPQRHDTSLKIPVARPTGDVRREILKSLHETLEAAKGQVRTARTDTLKALGGRGEEGTDDVQKATDRVTQELDKLQQSAKKELEK